MAYLFVDLLIHQMIGAKQSTVDPCLVQISIQALETVVQMVNARDRVGFSPRDLSSLVRTYRILPLILKSLALIKVLSYCPMASRQLSSLPLYFKRLQMIQARG
jgi:hypothetical protein